MTGVQAALAKAEPEQRLAAAFATCKQQLNIPVLLDSQGGNNLVLPWARKVQYSASQP
jgi:hypothetical protein